MSRAQQIRKEINNYLGTPALISGSDASLVVDYISTGLLPIDVLFGGGLPRGRYVELTGSYSTLKSYIGLNAILQIQKARGVAAIIDTEHAFDPEWADEIGVDSEELIVQRPETGELAIDIAEALIRSGVDLIVFDSIAATLPQAEAERRLHKESQQMARLAALMSRAFRKLTAANTRTAVLFINQMRDQVGVTFGPTERAPGGRAAGFYASMRANIRPAGKLTKDIQMFNGEKRVNTKETVGQTYRGVIEKSKLSRPWREVYFDWRLDINQIDLPKFLFTQGVDIGVVGQRGTMWDFEGLSIRGKDAFLKALSDSPEAMQSLENQVRKAHSLPLLGVPARGRKKAAASSSRSSKSKASGHTPVRGRAASSTTAAARKSLRK